MAYFLDFHIRPTTITDLKIKHSSDSGIKTLSDCTLKNDYYYGDGFGWGWGNGTVTFESTGYITKSIDVQTDNEYDITLAVDPTYAPSVPEDRDSIPTSGGKMINVRHIQKTDTSANWATSTLILLEGEIAYASDTGEIRIGDGKKTWNNLTTYVPKMGLNALNDTIITNLATGNVLKYNGTAWVNESLSGATVPAGSIISYAGATPPDGYLVCDGSAISRTTYAALFSAIGTTYGDGDGNSTFNLPDGTNRVLWGGGNGYLAEQLPNVKGYFSVFAVNTDVITDGQVFTQSRLTGRGESYQFQGAQPIYDFNAAGASPTYTDGGIVRPNSLQVQFCIKY